MKTQPAVPSDRPQPESRDRARARPVDGIVMGMDSLQSRRHPRSWVGDTWVVATSPEEGLAEFFLEDPLEAGSGGEDAMTWICRGLREDGSIVLGSVDFRDDRFLSEIFSDGEDE